MEILLALVIVVALAWFVSAPLRRRPSASDDSEDTRAAELEARKQALYRQIRDARVRFKQAISRY